MIDLVERPETDRRGEIPRAVEIAYVLAFPVVAVWLLGIALVNHYSYIDPEYYTGYGQSFVRMWNVFGLRYYAARFPVIALNMATQSLWQGFGGYVLARIVVVAITATPLYLLARRHYGSAVAMAAYAFLFVNPLFPRVLNWDLTTFLSIPMGLAGIATWLLVQRRWSLGAVWAGFLFWTSINAHIFTASAIGIFLAIDFLFALRDRSQMIAFWTKAVCATAGATVCLGLGVVFYTATVRYVSPLELWEITMFALQAGDQYMTSEFHSLGTYAAQNYEIYVPFITTAAALAALGRRWFADTLAARIAWFACAYCGFYLFSVFVRRMDLLFYFWYFEHLTIATFLAIPVIVAAIEARLGRWAALWFLLPMIALMLCVRLDFDAAARLSNWAVQRMTVAVGIVVVSGVAVAMLRRQHRTTVAIGTVALSIVLQAPLLSNSHLHMLNREGNAIERPMFDTIVSYQSLLNRFDTPKRRVITWYPAQQTALMGIAASNLLYTLHLPFEGPSMPIVDQHAIGRFNEENAGYVLLMDTTAAGVEAGLGALRAAGLPVTLIERDQWGYAPLTTSAALVRINK